MSASSLSSSTSLTSVCYTAYAELAAQLADCESLLSSFLSRHLWCSLYYMVHNAPTEASGASHTMGPCIVLSEGSSPIGNLKEVLNVLQRNPSEEAAVTVLVERKNPSSVLETVELDVQFSFLDGFHLKEMRVMREGSLRPIKRLPASVKVGQSFESLLSLLLETGLFSTSQE